MIINRFVFVEFSILRNVFATSEEKVVRSTLQRLPPQYVAALVEELTALTQQKTVKYVPFVRNVTTNNPLN